MPFTGLDFNIDYLSRPLNYTTSWLEEPQYLKELRLNCNTERKENNMDIRDKICDKCGKRYSIADMRIERDGEYVDKTCYYANQTPLEDYPKLYHSRADKKNVGREMDLCPECAKELKKFTGEQ